MQLTSLPSPNDAWLEFVGNQNNATIFHHPSWIEFLAECYGYTPYWLALMDDRGQIQGAISVMEVKSWLTGHRVVSLPFSDTCVPLATDESAGIELIQELQRWRKNNKLPELQIRWPLPLQEGAYHGQSFYQHFTTLTNDADLVYRTLKKTQVQRHIRQAEKMGVTIRLERTWADLLLFYDLHLRTRHRQGVPVQPLRYFRLLWERVIAHGLGFVLLAYDGAELVAGAVFLYYNKTITYKFGASDPKYWKLRPNDMIFWHAVRWGCENGYQVFDWGRTDLDNQGLRDFKRGWGSEELLLHYTILADRPASPGQMNIPHRQFMKAIIQRSPLWICRLLGELFYVHSA